ncbi:SIR2 family protein [Pseudomonas saxonica]|uniref:SIR2 family protein n=1 Tax=Pseudomonas saxonica TaxID=2600598 RepID=A0ABY3GNE7_9PSED|nr:SIR2 family protein [Pseudomonas saxonica]TWR92133.1 SIR2 family protein [Pseudomonas saxonica]
MHCPQKNVTREEVIHYLASSSIYGNLCLFVGAGFSKELVGDEALSWGELLMRAAHLLDIDFDFSDMKLIGTGYPEIASLICREYCVSKGVDLKESILQLKEKVAELTCWYPKDEKKKLYASHIDLLDPAWVVTTNYDLVIESLLPGRSVTIGPDQPLVFPKGRTPVYHLHGVRTHPEKIVLCREDYTALFRPNEYRQIKLALTLKESTTLLLGYSLGDDNVLTAFDWSRNVFDEEIKTYPSEVVQVVRMAEPRVQPYRGHNGALIIETSNLEDFFSELMPVVLKRKNNEELLSKKLDGVCDQLVKNPEDSVIKFIDNPVFRAVTLSIINASSYAPLIDGFIPFIDKCIDKTFERSLPYGHFEGYGQGLVLVLDILDAYGPSNMPPALFHKIANAFQRQVPFIGLKIGQSHMAGRLWDNKKSTLPIEQLKELKNYAQSKGWSDMVELLSTAPQLSQALSSKVLITKLIASSDKSV